MTPTESVGVAVRLVHLAKLEDGWLDGAGKAVTNEALNLVNETFTVLANQIPAPHLYPTEEGGISAEWSFGSWEVGAIFHPPGDVVSLQAVNVDTDDDAELEWHPCAFTLFADFVRRYAREPLTPPRYLHTPGSHLPTLPSETTAPTRR